MGFSSPCRLPQASAGSGQRFAVRCSTNSAPPCHLPSLLQYLGPQAEAQVVLAEAQNAFTWFTFPLKEVTWLEAVLQFAAGQGDRSPFGKESYICSHAVRRTPLIGGLWRAEAGAS